MKWHEIKAKHWQPSGRFDAQTWVDETNQLWLFGGQRVIRINGSAVIQHLDDLWKFNLNSCEWFKVDHQQNSTMRPKLFFGFSCFCHGKVFVFGHPVRKKIPELWVYNMSSNVWNLMQIKKKGSSTGGCFALQCNPESGNVSLLCQAKASVLKSWIFNAISGTWSSGMFTNKINFKNTTGRNVSLASQISLWNNPIGVLFVYIWPHSNLTVRKNSVLLSVRNDGILIAKVNNTEMEYMSDRKGFIRWIDSHGNLHLLGGRIANTKSPAEHWMLNTSDYTWVIINSKNLSKPSLRAGACFWHVSGDLWLFGGHTKDGKGNTIVLNDFWKHGYYNSKRVKPQILFTGKCKNLSGDTLGLSLAHKLIISVVTLIVVMAISIRLCYKRELSQLLSRLQKNRVLYHQLSQEGHKSTSL